MSRQPPGPSPEARLACIVGDQGESALALLLRGLILAELLAEGEDPDALADLLADWSAEVRLNLPEIESVGEAARPDNDARLALLAMTPAGHA